MATGKLLKVSIKKDTMTPHLRALLKAHSGNGAVMRILGRAAANLLRSHFRAKNSTPNKLGGARTNFWSRVAESVQPASSGPKIQIPIAHPAIAQKVFGGKLEAKKANHLAIPIKKEAYGRSPRTFADIELMIRGKTLLLGVPQSDSELNALYVLKKEVDQDKDKTALPSPAEMGEHLTKTLERLDLEGLAKG